ncbi:hypothetical protein [Bifidobacterium magnum]|uniref:Uncharacterized protein n=1 Tax=Bifidobacterium magnum TaxID=1692 RepID=A0A087BEZ1_9BIFI|nr:hypothetical protein [Bifidobacterium magnum]KFI69591.1 hypothetical protein BMAGN_1309 [Bifidobacterium magnum]
MAILQGFDPVSPSIPTGKSILTITQNSLHFNKNTVLELGSPAYVKFLINSRTKQFALQPCSANDPSALPFCKPDSRRVSVTMKSPLLLDAVLKYFTFPKAADDEVAYAALHGEELREDGIVIFDVDKAELGVMKKRGRKKGSTLK